MRAAGDDADAMRLRGLIVVLWRAGLRISEALALNEVILTGAEARSWSATANSEFGIRLVMPRCWECRGGLFVAWNVAVRSRLW
jgi:hypothetical protein